MLPRITSLVDEGDKSASVHFLPGNYSACEIKMFVCIIRGCPLKKRDLISIGHKDQALCTSLIKGRRGSIHFHMETKILTICSVTGARKWELLRESLCRD